MRTFVSDMTKVEQKVHNYIRQRQLLIEGQTVLIALSGGADSVCLLLLLKSLGYDCHAAHCNFHLRGEESDRDEQFVTDFCSKHNIPLHKTDFDTVQYAAQHGVSIEMAARDLRYAFFADVAAKIDTSAICIGHHRDDNAETFLLNAVRGTGITGLCGIRDIRMDGERSIVRPLLCLSRKDILAYLDSRQQEFVTDSTNMHDDVSRNKIRLNVIPQLLSINPAATDNLITTIGNLIEVERVYKAAIAKDIIRCQTSPGQLSVAELFKSVSPSSVLHEWLSGRGFNHSQEQDILQASTAGQSGKLFITDNDRLLVDREYLILESQQRFVEPHDITVRVLSREDVVISRDSHFAYLDADKIKGELHVRPVMHSDTFQPFGMKGRKLISDFLTDRKLNLFQKQHQLVMCDEADIVWVVGLRSSEKYRVDDTTSSVVEIRVKSGE